MDRIGTQTGRFQASKPNFSALPRTGDCYSAAGRLVLSHRFMDEHPDAVLIHAAVVNTGAHAGQLMGHAWVEADGMAFDFANGGERCIPAVLYRSVGKPTMIHEYTAKEARALMVETEHFGPWADELLSDKVL